MTESSSRPTGRHTKFFHFNPLSDEQIRAFEADGYLLLGSTLTDEGLAEARRQCMAAWTAEKGEFDAEKTWLQNSLLPNIHHQAPIVRDYYFEGPLVDVAEQLIGPNLKGATSQLTFKMRGNTRPFGWHQDNGYGELDPYNALTCLTALDDTDQENGCLWIIPGSQKQGQIKIDHSAQDKHKQKDINLDVDESQAVPAPLGAGECLIFSCFMLHKSDGNYSTDRDRRVLFLRYADADAVEVYNDRRPRLGKLIRGRTRFVEVAEYEAGL
jgi:hypothetical protein